LDPLLWDRALIEKIFDYQYTWEIYTPREKRKYGYYVLPVLYGERLVGRIEPVIVNGELVVKGIWLEPGVRKTRKLNQAINVRLKRFARFNDCTYTEQDLWDAPVQEPTHP
ncbi:MAG: winged helix DNA-binding domain-containing protein, partial [Solobacterium sp.]|nr:winged helix DNA-binding domain-containing protein [Solobacterium sp.]